MTFIRNWRDPAKSTMAQQWRTDGRYACETPGLTPPAIGTTHNLEAAYQMLFPGEAAPVHAHSMSALRFGLTGRGARMIIDGDRIPMEPGDLVLTPGWSWHGHVHPAGDGPVVWMDALDVPFVLGLRGGFQDVPPVGIDSPPHDLVMASEGGPHRLRCRLPQRRRALDIGEQERDRPRRRCHRHSLPRPGECCSRWRRRGPRRLLAVKG
jgi:hypothetical protein